MLVLINKILINLTEVLAITFKNPNTVCIADINKIYWEREYPTRDANLLLSTIASTPHRWLRNMYTQFIINHSPI